MSLINFTKGHDDIGILTINRPQVRNALNWEAMEDFSETVESAHQDDDLKALIVTGADGAFSSGGDLDELDNFLTRPDGIRLSTLMGNALKRLERLKIPTLAAMEGPALGGGAEVALACDMRVMAEKAVIGLVHIRLSIIPAWGGGQRLLRSVGYSRALEWISSGRIISAIEAQAVGLANKLAPEGKALEGAIELAKSITTHAQNSVKAVKRILQAGLTESQEVAESIEQSDFIDRWASPEHQKASKRFVSRKNSNSVRP
jgi:enoyl-CoA hydratase